MYGYSVIALPDLVIPPGGDLVIDTELMTVTLNGEDVTRFFGSNSEFFKLKPAENVLVYEDGVENRNISYRILWKDLWL
jgi:phage-related protein